MSYNKFLFIKFFINNRPAALRDHSEKLSILEFPRFIVPSLVARDEARIHDFIDIHDDCILKPKVLFDTATGGLIKVDRE